MARAFTARDKPQTSLRNYEDCGCDSSGEEDQLGGGGGVVSGMEASRARIRSMGSGAHSRVLKQERGMCSFESGLLTLVTAVWRGERGASI